LSILVIFAGAMIGTFLGFKAYVFLPEGMATNEVYLQGSEKPVPLVFELRNDRFAETLYPNGMIKETRTDLTVFDPERTTPLRKSIIVNDPLSYRGLTFYLADAYPLEEFFVEIRNRTTGMEQAFRVPPERDAAWPGTNASFRIEELKQDQDGVVRQARIQFTADTGAESSDFWVQNKDTVAIRQSGQEFTLSFRQLHTTLLLVTKDPGVWTVYFGCCLMVIGLTVIFFLSHRRIWIHITPGDEQETATRILVSGGSNKHHPAFERQFQRLIDRLGQDTEA
jgi:cytochrome c biogenesis protein